MKLRTVLFVLFALNYSWALSQKNNEVSISPLSLGIQVQTKYVWRGMEMQTQDAAPTLFPSITYFHNGISVFVMGGYSVNGKYGEVDWGISYTKKCITLGLADYYYPSIVSAQDDYFNYHNHETGHWFEGYLIIAPEIIPLSLTLSNFFAGADRCPNGKNAFSTYAELNTWHFLSDSDQLALNIGMTFNESCYNAYSHGFGICNIEGKYTHTIQFDNNWSLPVSVSYIINPVFEKSFVNFSANIIF